MIDDARTRRQDRGGGSYPLEVRTRAAELRRRGLGKEAIADELGVHPKTLQGWFRADGVAPVPPRRSPEALAREAARAERRAARVGRPHPGAKGHPPELREQAAQMRRAGDSRTTIVRTLGVGFSTVARWFREDGVTSDVSPQTWSDKRLDSYQRTVAERWAAQDAEQRDHEAKVGPLTARELLLVAAALYWAEGAKSKPWRRAQRVVLSNGDPDVINCFIAALEELGVPRPSITCRLYIHETADAEAALHWWRGQIGADLRFSRPGLKRHKVMTRRQNTGDSYHGCLAVDVRTSAGLYRLLAGTWQGVAAAASRR